MSLCNRCKVMLRGEENVCQPGQVEVIEGVIPSNCNPEVETSASQHLCGLMSQANLLAVDVDNIGGCLYWCCNVKSLEA